VGIAAVLSVIGLGACGGRKSASPPDPAFACNPSDASRPDKAQQEIAGYIPPPLPRRSCTLPQRGCTASARGGALPPPPGVRVASVTARSVHVVYNVGSELEACQPVQLVVSVDTSIDSLPPWGQNYPVSSSTGTLDVKPTRVRGSRGPADILSVSSLPAKGGTSEAARVRLPPPRGEKPLSDAAVRRIEAHQEACRPDLNDRTTCREGSLHPVAGPLRDVRMADLARSVRDSALAEGGSFHVVSFGCVGGARCEAVLVDGPHRIAMTYYVQALRSVPTCWESTGFKVTRPAPALGSIVAPLPTQGCVDR
jgi:hypothetical protein